MPVGTTQGLITRCPDCSTAFRASAEQLAARDGQVRCGRCGRVFDAVENAVPVLPAEPVIEHEPDDLNTAAASSPAESISPALDFAADAGSSIEPSPEPAGAAEAAAAAVFTEPEPLTASTVVALQADDFIFDATPAAASVKSTATATVEPLQWEFGRPKQATRSVPRWAGIPGVLVLSAVLLGQIAHHLRSDLVLFFPSVRPAAEQVCEWAGCDLPSPQRAELMSIESSDLQADSTNPAVMVLSATLRNRAPFPQAPPALELTLTDAQDQPTARRVLSAEDYSVRGVQNNLFPASSELPIKVYFEASAVKATGYRLYLFYP